MKQETSSLIVVGPFPPFVGGAAINTAQICDSVERLGVKVHRIATNKMRARGEHTRSIGNYVDRILNFFANLLRIMWARIVAPNATVYLVPDGGPGVIFSAAYARLSTILFPRLVVHHRSYGYIMKNSMAMSSLVRAAPTRTVHVFHDPMMQSQFETRYGRASQGLLSSNAALCDVQIAEIRKEKKFPVRIGFLSNLVEDKGFDVVADAFPKLAQRFGSDVQFLLAGRPIGTRNEARLRALRESLGDQIDYRGEVRGKNKQEFFESCDIFLFPSRFRQEASGNVLYESMAVGAAIVSTRWVGIPWVLQDTVSRLVTAAENSEDELVDAVADLIENEDLCSVRERQLLAFRQKKKESDVQHHSLLEFLATRSKK